jgi:hypothetical protein
MFDQVFGDMGTIGTASMKLCAVALVATSLVHSILGERRLIGPLLAQRDGVLAHDLARFLLRTVWHFMTVLFWMIAAVLWTSAGSTDRAVTMLLAVTAIGIGGAGIYDAIGSRGQHVGWPMLVLIGLLAGLALAARA